MRVRPAAPGDAAHVARVHRESWRTTYTGILPAAVIAEHALAQDEASWRRRLARADPDAATWVAECDGAPAGFASCGPARHRLEGLESEIYALYVVQGSQRRGAGAALVRACARHFVRHARFGFYLGCSRPTARGSSTRRSAGARSARRASGWGGTPSPRWPTAGTTFPHWRPASGADSHQGRDAGMR